MATKYLVIAALLLFCSFETSASAAPSNQQGNPLVGIGAKGAPNEAFSSALSADGNTAIVGGPADSSFAGAAWVYTRSGGVWSQQGDKLVGSGAVGFASQGGSVALSADGNTAIVGGDFDNSGRGAAWVYTRSGGVWSQQGGKLVGIGAAGIANQGDAVALSADGNTAIVGGFFDNASAGAAWVYTRSGSVWTQQGGKLVGIGAAGKASQGKSVALSGDGNTAVVGGPSDNSATGAAWMYTRTGGVWSQQGSKLVGTGAVGNSNQGGSVALAADGNTAIVGGFFDNGEAGAVWMYTRSAGVWRQQGDKLVGTGAIGDASQGTSVSLSGDGNTAIVGGPSDNASAGAAWLYTRSGGLWSQQGNKRVGSGAVGFASQGNSVALSGDGNTAVVGGASDNSGFGAAWVFIDATTLGVEPPSDASPAGIAFAPVNPNPASGVVTLRFTLPHAASVSLAIFDPAGRRIHEVASGVASAGEHSFQWNLHDESGRAAAAGVYLARLEVEGRVVTRKVAKLN